MQAPRICLRLLISLGVFLSCDKKVNKEQATVPAVAAYHSGVITEPISITEYHDKYSWKITQHFKIQNKRQVIIAKKGLKVTVNPSDLEKVDGSPVDGKINVKIIELTTSDELFKSNTATVSNGKLLASGGSYFIGMECNGIALRIKEGRSIKMELPKLKREEMELFYGERDSVNAMNWTRAGQDLDEISFTDSSRFSPGQWPQIIYRMPYEGRIFNSLIDPVYLYDQEMPLTEFLAIVNKTTQRIYIDSISRWPKNLPTGIKLDTNFLIRNYGPRFMYRMVNCRAEQAERDALRNDSLLRESAWQKNPPRSLDAQIQRYYAPAEVRSLGWINCDRFYRENEQMEVELELPITLQKSRIQYFVIFKSFNGLMSSSMEFVPGRRAFLSGLPSGERVTVVVFTKSNGLIYHGKENYVVDKNKKLRLGLTVISADEMSKIFGSNVNVKRST